MYIDTVGMVRATVLSTNIFAVFPGDKQILY